jgi:hypothetical protein
MSMDLSTMAAIQAEKIKEIAAQEQQPLDPEGKAMAETKRKTFDLPTNAVKVDPLR